MTIDVTVSLDVRMLLSAEPNVRPIKVYWDRVVLVSLEMEANLINMGTEYDGGNGGRLEWLDLAPPILNVADGGGDDDGDVLSGSWPLVDVLGQPAEALAVALPLQHAAHVHLQRSCVQLLQGNVSLGVEGTCHTK